MSLEFRTFVLTQKRAAPQEDEALEEKRGGGMIRGGSGRAARRMSSFAKRERRRLRGDARAGRQNFFVRARNAARYLEGRARR